MIVLLRLNHRVALSINYDITFLVFTFTSLEATLISRLRTVLLAKKPLAKRLIFPYTVLHDSETLE